MTITLSALQKQRYDTAANWTAENPTLLAGEIGVESDTGKIKIGTGATAWTSLSYSGLIPGSGVYPYSQLLMPSGTAGAPSISFDGDFNTGIYRPGAYQVAISTNGTGRLFVDSTGKVGIGTASPAGPLTIMRNGTVVSSGLDGSTVLTVQSTVSSASSSHINIIGGASGSTGEASITFGDVDDPDIGSIRYYNNGNSLAFNVNAAERLRITSTGQLSHIGAGSSGSPAVGFNGSAPANSLVIDSSGRLLVGLSSSLTTANSVQAKLQVSSTGSDASINLTRFSGASAGAGTVSLTKTRSSSQGTFSAVLNNDDLGFLIFNGDDGAAFRSGAWIGGEADGDWTGADWPGRLIFSTADGASSPTERMRIKSTGAIRCVTAFTVATLPTGEVGDIARVTDANAPSVGSTVTGGGAANALCWYNGTNWTVMGV